MRETTNPSPVETPAHRLANPHPQHRPLSVGSIVACPDTGCDQIAEVIDTWAWPSTSGPVVHARTRCLARHVFTPNVESIVPAADHLVAESASRVTSHA